MSVLLPLSHRTFRFAMRSFGPDGHRVGANQAQAMSHPVRVGILLLFSKDRSRSLAADDLRQALAVEYPESFRRYDVGQILYHRARLEDAELLPRRTA